MLSQVAPCPFIFGLIALSASVLYNNILPCYTKRYSDITITVLSACIFFPTLAYVAMATTTHPFPLPTYANPGYDGTKGGDIGNGGDSSTSSMGISTGGLIAIVVIVFVVAIIGGMQFFPPPGLPSLTSKTPVCTAILFFIAKKREWKASEVLRHSVKKVVAAITPRRTEFPNSVKRSMKTSKRDRSTLSDDDVPPTPRLRPEDLEKGRASGKVQSKCPK